jgi:signal transduction histidine kinase
MKLWQKIFIGTFILFEVIFNVSTLYLVQYNFNENLKKEVERGLTEQLILYSSIQSNNEFVSERFEYTSDFIKGFIATTFEDYSQYFDKRGVSIEVLDEKNQLVYNNFPLKIKQEREELQVPLSNDRKYIIRDIENQSFLFVTNLIKLENENFKLTYIRDISSVYDDRTEQYKLFIKINLLTALFLAVGLFILTRTLTRPITFLTESVKKITGGDYKERVKVKTDDEVGVLSDAFNHMSEAVENKVQELEKNSEMKQRFIESLTHELKTPLTSIIGYADFLRSTKYNEKIFWESLDYIYKEGKRLESISFKLMDLIMLGKQKLTLKSEDISKICIEIEEILRPRLQIKNLNLIISVALCRANIEKELFKVLLTNLIDNAIKASSEGAVIKLKAYINDAKELVIDVEDQGTGIPEKDVARVLEPFFMVDKSRTRAHQGAGLGLAICSEIVKLHNGKINIESTVNVGTKVQVIIP